MIVTGNKVLFADNSHLIIYWDIDSPFTNSASFCTTKSSFTR